MHHRLRDEVHDAAETERPGDDEDDRDDDCEACGQRGEPRDVVARERADRGSERAEVAGGADDEGAGRAEERVGDERAGRGGEAGRRRQPGDLRIRDRLRRDDAPDDEPRNEVATEPGAVVRSEPRGKDAATVA